MGLFSTSLKTELAKGVTSPGSPEIVVGLSLALPSGTIQVSDVGAGSTVNGKFEGRLVSLDPVSRGISLDSSEVQTLEVKAEIADPEFAFGRETQKYRNSLRRSAATLKVMSPNVGNSDAFTALSALLTTWESAMSPLGWSLTLRGDDKSLAGKTPEVKITSQEWPDADPEVIGIPCPHIYGTHSSVGLASFGMLPAYLVDRTGFRYLASVGWIKSIDRVYCGEVLQASTGYTTSRVTVNGIRFTLIDFTATPGEDPVRFDAAGYTDDAAGSSGTLITSPDQQILHFLVNFVFNKYRSGDWYANSTAPVEESSFTAVGTFCTTFSIIGAKWFGGDQTEIREELAKWAAGCGFKWSVTTTGKLTLTTVLDHRAPSTLYPSDFIRADEEEIERSLNPSTVDMIVRTVEGKYIYQAADAKYAETLRVTDLDVVEITTETLEMPGARAEL